MHYYNDVVGQCILWIFNFTWWRAAAHLADQVSLLTEWWFTCTAEVSYEYSSALFTWWRAAAHLADQVSLLAEWWFTCTAEVSYEYSSLPTKHNDWLMMLTSYCFCNQFLSHFHTVHVYEFLTVSVCVFMRPDGTRKVVRFAISLTAVGNWISSEFKFLVIQ